MKIKRREKHTLEISEKATLSTEVFFSSGLRNLTKQSEVEDRISWGYFQKYRAESGKHIRSVVPKHAIFHTEVTRR